MKNLLLIAITILAVGCSGKDESTTETKAVEEKVVEVNEEVKPTEEASLNPNFKYEIQGDAVTITGCDKKASGALIIPATIEGKSVTSIGKSAFSRCYSLTSIRIPDSVTSIGKEAFSACASLTSITVPDGVTSIGKYAFSNCSDLTSITIPDSVTSIGEKAFTGCTSLTSIKIPDGVTSIEGSAFLGCSSLTSAEVSTGNVNFADVNGVLFNKDKTVLHIYPAGKTDTNYKIPEGVTSIGESAFNQCTSLTSITIPDSVAGIGEFAFWECWKLTSITIPDGVTSIGGKAFYDCTSLTAVTFLGDAPKDGRGVFFQATPTIYRNPEAKGWDETWGKRPVKLISERP